MAEDLCTAGGLEMGGNDCDAEDTAYDETYVHEVEAALLAEAAVQPLLLLLAAVLRSPVPLPATGGSEAAHPAQQAQ